MTVVPFNRPPPDRRSPGDVIALVEDYWQLASRIAGTEFVPKAFRNRPEAVLAALLSGAERGLGPMESLRSVNVIEGKPSLTAEATRALVFAAGHEIEFLETSATKATVVGRRYGSEKTSIPFTWTLDRARRAGLAGKDNWRKYPEDMLRARVTAELCKAIFPDVVAGLEISEVVADDVEPAPTTTRRRATRPTIAPPSDPGEVVAIPPASPDQPPKVREQPPAGVADLGGIPGADTPSWGTSVAAAEPVTPADPATARRIHAELAQAFPGTKGATLDQYRHALVAVVTRRRPDGPQTSSTGISLEEQLALSNLITGIQAGRTTLTDGPDNTIELRAGGGWRYTIVLDPVAVTVHRGDQEAGETSPDTGEAKVAPAPDASPDQTSLDGLED